MTSAVAGGVSSGRAATALLVVLVAIGAGCRHSRLPPKPDGAAVVVSAEGAPEPGVTLVDEVEPNDLLATAQVLGAGTTATVEVAGHLITPPGLKAKDVDLFRITIPPPPVVTEGPDGGSATPRQRLSIELRPNEAMAISVDALDDQGSILVSAAGTVAGEVVGIPNLAVIAGTAFIRVKPGTASAAAPAGTAGAPGRRDGAVVGDSGYRLKVRLMAFEPGDEVEPNGKAALAGDVAQNGEVAGFFGWRHDEDWFRLPLAGLLEGSVLSVDLDPPLGVAASVAIYDSVEHKLTEQRGRKGDRVAIRNVRLPSSDPSVFVVARAEAGQNLEARYTLRLRCEEARSDAELEPNDDAAHAVPIGDGNFVGYLGPGDVDVYRYSSAMPVELDFEATPPDHVDLKIEEIREDGTPLFKVDAGKRREAERLANLYVSGSVLLRLSAGKGDGNLDEPYRIHASSRPVEVGAEREPNGAPALASVLPAGTSGTGLVFPRGDVDFWQTQTPVEPGATLAFSVRGIAGLTLDVRVSSNAGKELGRFRVGGDASAPTRVSPGGQPCCLVQIREATGRLANPRDRYALSVAP